MAKPLNLLPHVARWNIEAKAEDMGKLFYEFPAFRKVKNGDYIFVKGRKGSGKTAILQYIRSMRSFDHFSKSITLDRSPIEFFQDVGVTGDLPLSAYVLIWRYVIYSAVVDLFTENERVKAEIGRELDDWFPASPEKQLAQVLGRSPGNKISVGIGDNVLTPGLSFSTEKKFDSADINSLARTVELLGRFIYENCDDSKYYVMFDGLDAELTDATRSGKSYEKQQTIIRGLIKSCFDERLSFRRSGLNVIPLVFIRTDMFDDLRDSDSEKWEDFVCDLKWRKDQIHNMLSHRICHSAHEAIEDKGFRASWKRIVFDRPVEIENKRSNEIFRIKPIDYIHKRTFSRPRDFIRYIQIVAKVTDEYDQGYTRIAPKTFVQSEDLYSRRFRKEIVDEMHSVLKDVDGYLDAFGKIHKIRYFSFHQIQRAFAEEGNFDRDLFEKIGLENILKFLFEYSVVGNIDKRKDVESQTPFYYRTFKYNFPTSVINYREKFTLHSGLFRSIYESKSRNSLALADKANTIDLTEKL
ncbi:hypothetical protein QMT40_003066 [Parvibaculaceae bacterium PLY_AMNH_Bact1]|nr:hypothetical protein QMT40_003066 [Parvibaculaceae bacterium PLY_AMNH_Bact1]